MPSHVVAAFVALELDRLRDAVGGFVSVSVTSQRTSRPLRGRLPRRAAEQVAEDVAEGGEDVVDVGEVVGAAWPFNAGVAVAVVAGPLVRVAEHLEGLGRLLEPLDRLLVARILVGVILHGQLAIGRRRSRRRWRIASTPSTS